MAAVAERSIRIAISRDGVRAHLIANDVDPRLVTRANIIASLQESGIPVSEEVMGRIMKIEQAAREGTLPAEPSLLAEGRDPVEGVAAVFEMAPELVGSPDPEQEGEDRTDFHRSHIVTVAVGTVIGTLSTAVPPTPGADVHGKPVHIPPPLRSVQLGKNVQLGPDGVTVLAAVPGKVHLTRHEISVLPVVEIPADIDFNTGNLDATTDVLINGTVRESFQVKSAGSVTVRGAIEAAEVVAGTDLQVNGGITSHGHGHVASGGELFTKFLNEARVEAGRDVTIVREAMNSWIRTAGHLLVERGKLIGGRAYARAGAVICQLGNDANVKTAVAVGVDPLALLEVAAADELIKKKRDAIAKIRQNVQPLMAQLKRLTPAQRERATELLYQADAMEHEVAEQEKKKHAALQPDAGDGREVSLVISKIIYPGVTVVFGDRSTTFQKERKGPFKLVRRVHNRAEEILLIDKLSGSVNVLNSRGFDPKSAEADFR